MTITPAVFTIDDAERAHDAWGANCGPGAIAAALNLTLDDIRPHLGDFETKRYTSPTMMHAALKSLGVVLMSIKDWPTNGVVRVQWEGPWTAPGVPIKARYRHSHWVASRLTDHGLAIFDINCMCAGGWVLASEWRNQVVPWLLKEIEPKASGKWHATSYLKFLPR